jgi:nucleotide-binding universal stress UspA family protein
LLLLELLPLHLQLPVSVDLVQHVAPDQENHDQGDDRCERQAEPATRLGLKARARVAVTTTWEAVEGNPAHALIAASEDADLLVVGSRGHGAFVGALLGSVSQQVVAHARCPVVVVPTPPAGEGRTHAGNEVSTARW